MEVYLALFINIIIIFLLAILLILFCKFVRKEKKESRLYNFDFDDSFLMTNYHFIIVMIIIITCSKIYDVCSIVNKIYPYYTSIS
jgi:hypothetical protein